MVTTCGCGVCPRPGRWPSYARSGPTGPPARRRPTRLRFNRGGVGDGADRCSRSRASARVRRAAVVMRFTTSSGWETIATWLVGTSMVVAPSEGRTAAGHRAGSPGRRRRSGTGRQRLPGRDAHHLSEGAPVQRLLDREHDLGLDRVDIGREMVGHGSSRGSSLARRRSGPRAALPVAAPPVASSPSTITAGVRAVAAGSPPSSPYDGRGRRDRSSQTPVCCEITSMRGADDRSCLTPPPRPPSPWPGLVPGRRSPPGSRRTDSAGRSAGAPCRPRSAPKAAPDPWR
jgi:hypothetical protein